MVSQSETFTSVACFEDSVPARLQDPSREHADDLFVFHQQNDFGALGRRGNAASRMCHRSTGSILRVRKF